MLLKIMMLLLIIILSDLTSIVITTIRTIALDLHEDDARALLQGLVGAHLARHALLPRLDFHDFKVNLKFALKS